MKVVSIVGARPQFVKAAAVSRAIAERPGIEEVLVHTGQHYDTNLSDVFFQGLQIPAPAHNLGIGSLSHGAQTGRMLEAIEEVLVNEAPDWALVYGDTNSTLAGALAAAKLHIPVAHVEAGLRSFNRHMPEEVNRVLTDHASDLLFAPTSTAVANLKREGIDEAKIRVVGDVMYDVTSRNRAHAEQTSTILSDIRVEERDFVLATVHRAENTDDLTRLESVFGALVHASAKWPVVVPLHPRTKKALITANIWEPVSDALTILAPVSYHDMVRLEGAARVVVTDSGGVQKEAFFVGTPCVTVRDETEWVELVELGWNRIVPPKTVEQVANAIAAAAQEPAPAADTNPYGDGRAAEKIAAILVGET